MRNWKEMVVDYGYGRLEDYDDIQEARQLGFRIHKEFRGIKGDENNLECYDWYAATNKFVLEYHNNGGTWNYSE